MKSKIVQICAVKVPGIPVILFFIGCKNFGMPGYELSITIEREGQDTPASSVYTHGELTVVESGYTPLNIILL
jgi:hypothetical protein